MTRHEPLDSLPTGVARSAATPHTHRIALGGTFVDLMHERDAIDVIIDRAAAGNGRPLGVLSANLDHIYKFGHGARWGRVLEQEEADGGMEWLSLLDGTPLVRRARQIVGHTYPRLAGSDLIGPVLEAAADSGVRVGFLGGAEETLQTVRAVLAWRLPGLEVVGTWAPERAVITNPISSQALTSEIRAAGVDMLVVCMGKPRQELWIAQHGADTGAGALLAFGAVVDFIAGRIDRAPQWMAKAGLEWTYRLAHEPRRLARRYLVQGPRAYVRLRRHSGTSAVATDVDDARAVPVREAEGAEPVLVVGPDARLAPGAVDVLRARVERPSVGAAVGRAVTPDGRVLQTLRIDGPGRRQRVDRDPESYQFPHPVDAAVGAGLMVRREVVEELGQAPSGDELSDYLRSVRDAGWQVWFEPTARVVHEIEPAKSEIVREIEPESVLV